MDKALQIIVGLVLVIGYVYFTGVIYKYHREVGETKLRSAINALSAMSLIYAVLYIGSCAPAN